MTSRQKISIALSVTSIPIMLAGAHQGSIPIVSIGALLAISACVLGAWDERL